MYRNDTLILLYSQILNRPPKVTCRNHTKLAPRRNFALVLKTEVKLPLGEISPLFIECVTTYKSFFTERRNFTSGQNLTCDGPLNSIKNSQHFWLLVIMVYIFLDFSCHIPSLLVSLSLCNARFYTTMDHQCLNFVFQAHRLPRSLQILILAAF